MSEPADKEDVKVLVDRLDKLGESFKGLREQNSAEHGSLFTKLTFITSLTGWLKDSWIRFTILPPPPVVKPTFNNPPKDGTQ
jgi:hypothetical protein